jgi:hypothetical protein
MTDILEEIDQALRRERAAKLWKEYGPSVITGLVALVIFTGIFSAYNHWTFQKNQNQSALLIQALEQAMDAEALNASLKDLKGTHRALAMFHLAAARINDQKPQDAIALYREISVMRGVPDFWRDLAMLNAIRLEWDAHGDTAQAKAYIDALKPLLPVSKPWAHQAAIQAALIAGDGLKDYTQAMRYLNPVLNSPTAPASLKTRAQALDHIYAMRAAESKAAIVAPETETKG